MKITIVGTGNVAAVLGKLFLQSNHTIVEVYGRNANALNKTATMLKAKAATDITQLNQDIDVCIIAVSDSAIEAVTKQIKVDKTLVVHTSGATSKKILKHFKNYGVLYPLQSLRKEISQTPAIPFFVDANKKENIIKLTELASSTGNDVSFANDEQRLQLHVAAVLCSNFTNHLYALAADFCQKENINFQFLFPLIKETAERLQFFPAAQLQTGPAIRHDELTLQRHLHVLQSYPQLIQLYNIFTQSIQQFSKSLINRK